MLSPGLEAQLEAARQRLRKIQAQLASAAVATDPRQVRELGKEQAELQPVVTCFARYRENEHALKTAHELLRDEDPEMRRLAAEELASAEQRGLELEQRLRTLLLPRDPNDDKDVFVEIRAGTGGEEAALFVGDLARMYSRYAETRSWLVERIHAHSTSLGGFRELVLRVSGAGVYRALKFESGVHRVQRVPETESQGRVHTSTCTLAVLPEADTLDAVELNPQELRVDTFRASGAGGQHVNKTDSAVRITHLPSNTVVECQAERSQHQNRARAMALLRARLADAASEHQRQERDAARRLMVGSGDRSQRIRTYNFPQGRVTDHRISLTLYKLENILLGDLGPLIEPLLSEYQAAALAAVESA